MSILNHNDQPIGLQITLEHNNHSGNIITSLYRKETTAQLFKVNEELVEINKTPKKELIKQEQELNLVKQDHIDPISGKTTPAYTLQQISQIHCEHYHQGALYKYLGIACMYDLNINTNEITNIKSIDSKGKTVDCDPELANAFKLIWKAIKPVTPLYS